MLTEACSPNSIKRVQVCTIDTFKHCETSFLFVRILSFIASDQEIFCRKAIFQFHFVPKAIESLSLTIIQNKINNTFSFLPFLDIKSKL